MTEINQGAVLYTTAQVLEHFLKEEAPTKIRESATIDTRLSRDDWLAHCHAVENLIHGFIQELEQRIDNG